MAKEASGLTEVLVRRIQTDSGITELRNDARFQLNKRITQAWDMLLKEMEELRISDCGIKIRNHQSEIRNSLMLLKEMEKRRVENGASRNPDS